MLLVPFLFYSKMSVAQNLWVRIYDTQLVWHFQALERVTVYQNGFSKDSQVIKWFWELVSVHKPSL